jgi:hypothetical protein
MKAPYTIFGKTKLIPVSTFTRGKEDSPAKQTWDKELWVERGEDWYALLSVDLYEKTVRVVKREIWLREKEV